MTIYCANPAAQFYKCQNEIELAVLKVLRSGQYILGTEVDAFENEFSEYLDVKYAIGVANGTDAIEIAIRALDIKPGDEIITVSHTAVATVAAIESVGAIPVLVDVDPFFYTLDPSQLNSALSPKTKAVIVVHLYGQPADLEAIANFCKVNDIYLIEDCSQAHGAKWQNKFLGTIGHLGCFSCYPTKNLGAFGDAGIIVSNDKKLAEKVKLLRQYGWQNRYISNISGRNSRLDEIQAAILRVKLKYLNSNNLMRRKIAGEYSKSFANLPLNLPNSRLDCEEVFHLYVIRFDNREKLRTYLEKYGIQTGIHYPMPIHMQPAYKSRIKVTGQMETTEKIAGEVLSLPMYPELLPKEVNKVIETINTFFY